MLLQLARNIRNQRGGRAVVGRDTFKGDGLHVGRDIKLEKQSTWHSEHSSTLRQVQDEILRGRGVRVNHPSGYRAYSDPFPLRWDGMGMIGCTRVCAYVG